MSEHILKTHNKTLLLYHIVLPVRYRNEVFTEAVKQTLVEVCKGISSRYEMNFLEVGTDIDHVHFLVQSIPTFSVSDLVTIIKSLTAREIFIQHKDVKKLLWGGKFWSSSFYANTVSKYGTEEIIKKYVKKQGMNYERLYKDRVTLFD